MDGLAPDTVVGPASVLRRARQIADDVLFPAAMAVEDSHRLPPAHLDLLAEQGFYGMAGPAEYSGMEVDIGTAGQVIEILASGCLSTAFVWIQHHGAVLAVANSGDDAMRQEWLEPLCRGRRRAGVALAGTLPGPPVLRARPVTGGYLLDGISPWVTGWGSIDTLYTAARAEDDSIIWALLDAKGGPTLSVLPLNMVAVMASATVEARFSGHFVAAERVTGRTPASEWRARDAGGLRINGSLALGVAARCCEIMGPGPLDDELARCRAALDSGEAATMPEARAAASALAMKAAAALVVAQGARAILADQHAQRLAREALFLLVFGSRPAIKAALTGLLADSRP